MTIITRKPVFSLTLLMLCALFMSRFAIADNIAPTEPGEVRSARYSSTAGEILWTAATDNVGVIGYQVSRDGESLGVFDAKSLYEPALVPDRAYTYIIRAVDRQGNQGAALQVQISAIRGEKQEGRPVAGTDTGVSTDGS